MQAHKQPSDRLVRDDVRIGKECWRPETKVITAAPISHLVRHDADVSVQQLKA